MKAKTLDNLKPFLLFEDHCKKLNLKNTQLAQAIGYSGSAWARWKKEGYYPKVAWLAAECLIRRNGTRIEEDKVLTLIVRIPDSKVGGLLTVCEAMNIEVTEL